ncbi:MAG: hypothetical protein ACLGH4_04100 [Actinomycetes bacterium]
MRITRQLRSASGHAARVTRVEGVARWHVRSQEVARRNAMVSMTELTQRRLEREDVEAFLARHRQRYHEVG